MTTKVHHNPAVRLCGCRIARPFITQRVDRQTKAGANKELEPREGSGRGPEGWTPTPSLHRTISLPPRLAVGLPGAAFVGGGSIDEQQMKQETTTTTIVGEPESSRDGVPGVPAVSSPLPGRQYTRSKPSTLRISGVSWLSWVNRYPSHTCTGAHTHAHIGDRLLYSRDSQDTHSSSAVTAANTTSPVGIECPGCEISSRDTRDTVSSRGGGRYA